LTQEGRKFTKLVKDEISTTFNMIIPGDWFAIGQIFKPYAFENPNGDDPSAKKFGSSVGVQFLAAVDYQSSYNLDVDGLQKVPSALTAKDMLPFLEKVMKKHRKPRIGFLLAASTWQSSTEMLSDPQTAPRAQWLKSAGIEIGPMLQEDKDTITEAMKAIGLRVEFDETRLLTAANN
jgi:hypothetical protein